MVALRENHNKTKFYVPDRIVCKIKIDPELVMLCQRKGDTPHRGTPIGQMKELWPFDALKRAVVEEAQTFVGHMAKQGNILQGSVHAIELWGPYKDKPVGSNLVNIEEGNPLVPEGRWAGAAKGVWSPETLGPRYLTPDLLDTSDFRSGTCFRLRGNFLKTRGKQEETTGVVIL